MNKAINPMLLCDFYKTVHSDMIHPKMTKSMSYYTPRMSRVKRWDKVVMFGVQMFCKTWLIDYFNDNFFHRRDSISRLFFNCFYNTSHSVVLNCVVFSVRIPRIDAIPHFTTSLERRKRNNTVYGRNLYSSSY